MCPAMPRAWTCKYAMAVGIEAQRRGGGPVCLNRVGALLKWMSTSVTRLLPHAFLG
jgi:hypothetical protein